MKKTKMKRSEQTAVKAIEAHPEAIMQALPPGFVVMRLSAEMQQLFTESRKLGALMAALDKLKAKPGYERIEDDMREALGVPKEPEVGAVPAVEEKQVGLLRRVFG